jgi:hypothetical protein
MPVVFGPSELPEVTRMGDVCSVSIAFRTEVEAVAPLLPPWFQPLDPPVVTVVHSMLRKVDYLGGRGYNLVRVQVSAAYRGPAHDPIDAAYALVIWENDTRPIVLGRELGGYAKVFGDVTDLVATPDGHRFEVGEDGARLLDGEVSGLVPVTGGALAAQQAAARTSVSLGWKYVPGLGKEPDVDYPTKLTSHAELTEVWTGTGSVRFARPDRAQAPVGARIVERLGRLPVLEALPSTLVRGSSTLPRRAVVRL